MSQPAPAIREPFSDDQPPWDIIFGCYGHDPIGYCRTRSDRGRALDAVGKSRVMVSADAKGNRACNRCHSRHPSVPLRLRLD
jgi:hypothetical protein